MSTSSSPSPVAVRVVTTLLPLMGMVLIAFVIIGLGMPVLPLHVHDDLHLGAFAVGLVGGAQFAASFVSRLWAGHYADRRGPKRAVMTGLQAAVLSGLLYMISLRFVDTPMVSVAILLAGRALLGGAESFIITGALSWGLALVDARNAGKVMAWIGMSMYAAFALGAPAGATLYAGHGFAAIAWATTVLPLVTLALVVPLRAVAPQPRVRSALAEVAAAVWMPGLGLAFSSVGFGAITTFVALLFVERHWGPAWVAFTAFAGAFIAARMLWGHLPDKIGGAKAALVFLAFEAVGQVMIWLAPWPNVALVGAVLTGLGYSLVYPGFGVEAVLRAPPQSRGLAMGAYTAFLDVALGIANPALGLVAAAYGLGAVFLVSALVVLGATVAAVRLLQATPATDGR